MGAGVQTSKSTRHCSHPIVSACNFLEAGNAQERLMVSNALLLVAAIVLNAGIISISHSEMIKNKV
jgi:hypothetical protein